MTISATAIKCTTATLTMYPRSRHPFRGWAAKITDWPADARPALRFGTWRNLPSRDGGVVTLEGVAPGEIVLYGANAPDMRAADKFTFFGRVMRNDDATLRIERLAKGQEARTQWLEPPLELDAGVIGQALTQLQALAPTGKTTVLAKLAELINTLLRAYLLKPVGSLDFSTPDYMEKLSALDERLQEISRHFAEFVDLANAVSLYVEQWKIARQAVKAAAADRAMQVAPCRAEHKD